MTGQGGDSIASLRMGHDPTYKTWQVDCQPLEAFIDEQQIDDIDLIKIDVEGAEDSVLLSIKDWLYRQRVTFAFESK